MVVSVVHTRVFENCLNDEMASILYYFYEEPHFSLP